MDDKVIYKVSYELVAIDNRGASVWELSWECIIACQATVDATEEQINDYVSEIRRLAHDNLRMTAQDLTSRAGLPPLVIDVFVPSQPA